MNKIDHLGIAVKDLKQSIDIYKNKLGFKFLGTEEVEEQKVKVAMFECGESRIELLEPTSKESPISKFLEKRGPGIHHTAIKVNNIEKKLQELSDNGVTLIDKKPRTGAEGCKIAFVHPKSTSGVLLELVE